MIRLRLATSDGFREIAPATLHRCGFADGCEHACYVDGPADADPYYYCEIYEPGMWAATYRRWPVCD